MASVYAFHLKVVLRRLEGVGECVGEVVGDFCVCCVAVAVDVGVYDISFSFFPTKWPPRGTA